MAVAEMTLTQLVELATRDENIGTADERAAVIAARTQLAVLSVDGDLTGPDYKHLLDKRAQLGLDEEAADPALTVMLRAWATL